MTQNFLDIEDEQEFSLVLGRISFLFRFYAFRNLMYMDISTSTEQIANGKRIMANRWLLPSYVAHNVGNLRFETYAADGDDYVWYEEFNSKFRLVSYSAEEIAAMQEESE